MARTGCDFSLVSAVGRCVRGGGGDDNLRISRLAKVDRTGDTLSPNLPPGLGDTRDLVRHFGYLRHRDL